MTMFAFHTSKASSHSHFCPGWLALTSVENINLIKIALKILVCDFLVPTLFQKRIIRLFLALDLFYYEMTVFLSVHYFAVCIIFAYYFVFFQQGRLSYARG